MGTFIDVPITVEPEQLITDVYQEMAERFPGWTANPGAIETWLVRAMVYRLIVPLAELSADVPADIFAKFGQEVHNVPMIQPTAASANTTWRMVDDAGYTIPEGAELLVRSPDGTLYGFRVAHDVAVLAGATTTATGEVAIEATEPGLASNGLTGEVDLVDALSFVDDGGITLEGATSGGVDGEDPLDYLNRLVDTLRTLAPRPILPRDVEIIARSVAGVARCSAIDGYNPDNNTYFNPRMLAAAVIDENGAALSSGVKAEVDALLQARREINFVFSVIDPHYSTIKVNFRVRVFPGFDRSTVEGAVIDALTAYLSPGNWGKPPFGPGGDDQAMWLPQTTVRYQDLSTIVNNVPGVDYHTTLKLAKGSAVLGTADVTLTGPAPLPRPGVIQVGS